MQGAASWLMKVLGGPTFHKDNYISKETRVRYSPWAESIVEEWKGKPQTFETWKHRFRAATNSLAEVDSGFVSQEEFHREEAVHKQAKDFKTPRRNRVNQFMEATNAKVYKSLFAVNTKFEEDSTQQYVEHMDSSLADMCEELETSKKVQKFLGNLVHDSVRSAEVKLQDLKDTIGHAC